MTNEQHISFRQRGWILPVTTITVVVVLLTTLLIIGGAQLYFQGASYSTHIEQSLSLAESGIDKAVASLNKNPDSYTGECEVFLGEGSYCIEVSSKDDKTKVIKSTGYYPNKITPKARRVLTIEATKGIGVSFVYGVQVGEGGLQMGENNKVEGSIYSNGDILASNGNQITGDVWVAGGQQPDPDQQT